MARKNRTPEENARREKIRELLQMANIGSMDDIQNLFKETIAEFMENGLEAELDDELGYSKYDYTIAARPVAGVHTRPPGPARSGAYTGPSPAVPGYGPPPVPRG